MPLGLPNLQNSIPMKPTSRPFLGLSRVNKIIALANAVLHGRVVFGPPASAGSSTIGSNAFFSFSPKEMVLTLPPYPTTIQSNGTNQGWFWPPGQHNWNSANAYQDQQTVYMKPTDTAVTTGLLDHSTGVVTKSVAGVWVALQNVPAPSGGVYYVPQIPLPVPGDLDNPANFWFLISADDQCLTGT